MVPCVEYHEGMILGPSIRAVEADKHRVCSECLLFLVVVLPMIRFAIPGIYLPSL